MQRKSLLFLALFMTMPAWSQVQPSATGDLAPLDDESRMVIPPLTSGMLYPSVAATDQISNFVTASLTTNAAYTDNVIPSSTAKPQADQSISVLPSFTYERKTPRQQVSLSYNPSFTFYKNTTGLNAMDQGAVGIFQSRLSPHITLGIQDFFVRTSNVFNTSYPFAAGGLTGSAQTPVPALVLAFAEQIRNSANVDMAYQFSSKGMIGGSGLLSTYRFPNKSQSPGVYESDGVSASGFYNRRLSRSQYVGLLYQYSDTLAYPANSKIETQVQAILPFYTAASNGKFSLSVAGGVQHVLVAQRPNYGFKAWSPTATVSVAFQGNRGNLAASYLYTVVAGQGLLGAFNSNSANFSGGWKLARTWTGEASVAYQWTDLVTVLPTLPYQGGQSIMAMATLGHSMGDHFNLQFGYDRLHQEYNGLAVISGNPDSNREFITVTYKLTRFIGR